MLFRAKNIRSVFLLLCICKSLRYCVSKKKKSRSLIARYTQDGMSPLCLRVHLLLEHSCRVEHKQQSWTNRSHTNQIFFSYLIIFENKCKKCKPYFGLTRKGKRFELHTRHATRSDRAPNSPVYPRLATPGCTYKRTEPLSPRAYNKFPVRTTRRTRGSFPNPNPFPKPRPRVG
jgi:hypothetical protein